MLNLKKINKYINPESKFWKKQLYKTKVKGINWQFQYLNSIIFVFNITKDFKSKKKILTYIKIKPNYIYYYTK